MLNLTIAIPVKNEEKNLPGCLAAIGSDFASKVIIIDSGSTDSTLKIAKNHNIDVIDFVWNGKFPKKRNWYLRNHTPKTEWVLFLDADEYLTEDFKTAVRKCLHENEKVGYWLNYTRYFLGKKLKGGYPLTKLALFKVSAGEYEVINEDKWSNLDMEVHEHPVLKGEIGTIKSEIDHKDFRGISHYVIKHNEYAAWEAERFLKTFNDGDTYSKLTWKQKLKYRMMKSVFIGPIYFLASFFFMGGFLDGYRGLVFAILKMSYFTQIYSMIKEKGIPDNL